MADNTATFILDGEVSLHEFAKAISNFNELIAALSEESGVAVEWIVDDLSVSSAMASIVGLGDENHVQRVLADYSDVGQALQAKTEIHHSQRAKNAANKIVSISDPRISSVRFETAKREAVIPLRVEVADRMPLSDAEGRALRTVVQTAIRLGTGALGAIQGRIQTLTSRGRLRFTLYDLFYDKAVSCYFAEGKQESIRDLWGKLALVEGFVVRDPATEGL